MVRKRRRFVKHKVPFHSAWVATKLQFMREMVMTRKKFNKHHVVQHAAKEWLWSVVYARIMKRQERKATGIMWCNMHRMREMQKLFSWEGSSTNILRCNMHRMQLKVILTYPCHVISLKRDWNIIPASEEKLKWVRKDILRNTKRQCMCWIWC